MILAESAEAAAIQPVTGWVSRLGRFWGSDERGARYDGSTHHRCETDGCDAIVERDRLYCRICEEARAHARYEAAPKRAWDGVGMLFSDAKDAYYPDLQAAEDALEDGETIASLRLLLCEPNRLSEIDESHWCDDLSEDGELPNEVAEALAALNVAIREAGPSSWSPGKFAIDLTAPTA
jgi:hypothetical protein